MEIVIVDQNHPSLFKLIVDKEISLRTFHPEDAEGLFQLLEQNRARFRPWIHPKTLHETAKATRIFTIECFFDRLEETEESLALFRQYSQDLDGHFLSPRPSLEMGIWYHGSLVGFISVQNSYDSYTAAEFGYWLAEEWVGKGIITRCVSALMDYKIANSNIERFVIQCAATNLRSRAVAERLRYRLHMMQPNGEVVGEFVYDRAIYGIRVTAWQGRNKANSDSK